MFDNDYQTNVLTSVNLTLYINNVRLRGVYKSDPRHEGVIFHYWEPLSNKCSAHLINTYLTNPLPQSSPPPYFSQYYSHTPYTPILPYISPKAHTTFNIYLIPKRVFVIKCLQLPIDKYLKVTYNKFIRTASPNNLIRRC